MVKITHGLGTKVGLGVGILALLPPLITQIVALVENVSAHFTEANKVSLISGAATVAVVAIGKFAQAVAAILKGSTEV